MLISVLKVYLTAIRGYVPSEMLKCISAFIDVCYIVRRGEITESALAELQTALKRFHEYRQVFQTLGVRADGFSLPCQHSLIHYLHHIMEFGAPNGLCSSITESRHITAVKKPWRRSSRYNALGQMLTTNQRLDKLAAARTDFWSRGMLPPMFAPPPEPTKPAEEDEDESGPTDVEHVTGNVTLARTRGTLLIIEES